MQHASKICAQQVQDFINYLHKIDPELKWHEAILIAGIIINQLPDAFTNNPEMLTDLKTQCQKVKQQRRSN